MVVQSRVSGELFVPNQCVVSDSTANIYMMMTYFLCCRIMCLMLNTFGKSLTRNRCKVSIATKVWLSGVTTRAMVSYCCPKRVLAASSSFSLASPSAAGYWFKVGSGLTPSAISLRKGMNLTSPTLSDTKTPSISLPPLS